MLNSIVRLSLEITKAGFALSAFRGNDSIVINGGKSPRKGFMFTQQPSTQEQKHLANICIFIIDGSV